MSIRVVVVDDFGVVRAGLRLLLDAEEDIVTVGELESVEEAAVRTGELRPDVVLLDCVMHGRSTVDAIPALLATAPEAGVLVISTVDDPACVRAAFGAGARGFVLKEAPAETLVDAVREVAAGQGYLDPALGARLVLAERESEDARTGEPLSQREREVVRLLALGHSCAEVAAMLGRSPRTVEAYRAQIAKKLALRTRSDLVHYALTHGLLGNGGAPAEVASRGGEPPAVRSTTAIASRRTGSR